MKTTFIRKAYRCLWVMLVCCVLPLAGWGQADVWNGSDIASGFSGGDGSEGTPYLISSAAELAYLAQLVNAGNNSYNDKSYKLTKDIDLNNKEWTPIGDNSDPSYYKFKGNFDGGNYTISNLCVTTSYNAGLFGCIGPTKDIVIQNLGIILGKDGIGGTKVGYVGGITADLTSNDNNTATIRNCFVTGSSISALKTSDMAYAGGLVGHLFIKSTIKFCYVNVKKIEAKTVNQTARSCAGGLIGGSEKAINMTNCLSFCGSLSSIKDYSSFNKSYAANLVADINSNGTYTNCFSSPFTAQTFRPTDSGDITTTYPTGTSSDHNGTPLTPDNFNDQTNNALYGWATQGWEIHPDRLPTLKREAMSQSIDDFMWGGTGEEGNPYQIKNETHLRMTTTAAIFQDRHYIVKNSFELTTDWTPLEDFSGTLDGDGHIISGLNIPQSASVVSAGLFANLKSGAKISNLGVAVKDEVTASGGSAESGGIAANCELGAIIENSFVTGGKITGKFAGCIAGTNAGTITDCYATSPVEGAANASIGGICGTNTGTVNNSYAIGKITGTQTGNKAGGISGSNTGTIKNCLALNKEGISGIAGQGRITGENSGTLTGNQASPLISGSWSDATDGTDGDVWNGETYPFPAARTTTVWNMEDTKFLPRLQAFIDRTTGQPSDNLQRPDYGAYAAAFVQPTGGMVGINHSAVTLGDGKIPGNTELTLTNSPNPGYRFKEYTINSNSISGDKHTLINGVTISAVFIPLYTVTIDQPDAAKGSFTASNSGVPLSDRANADIPEGTVLTLQATPAAGYKLTSFTAGGVAISGNTYTVNSDVTLSAEFEPVSGSEGGSGGDPTPPTPTVYHTVTLPAVEGAVTDPEAGDYEVEAWGSFRFYLTVDKEYDQSVPVVTTSRGETITPRSSDGAYILNFVRQPVEIFIDGIAKNPDPVANETVATDAVNVWAAKGNLHISTATAQTVQVYNLAGSLVKQADIPVGDTQWQLPSGIYIVRIAATNYKVIL